MPNLKSAFISVATALVCVSGAVAAPTDPNVQITVTPYPDGDPVTRASSVTLTSGRYDTFVAYRVELKNNTTNTLNRSFFSASTAVVGAPSNDSSIDPVIIVESETVPGTVTNCAPTGGPTTLRCVVGQSGSLFAGQGATFWVVVKSPTAGTQLILTSTFGGAEGNGVGNGCCDSVRTTTTALIDPVTDTGPDPKFKREVRSFVNSGGGTFYTGGTLQAALPDDPWVTIVRIPAVTNGLQGLPFTTATILEQTFSNSCAPYALANGCFETDLSVPGTFASLQITIRWDASKIKNGTKAENVKLFYTGHNAAISYPIELQLCTADAVTHGSAPSSGRPCLEDVPFKYTKQAYPGLPDYWGDIEFRVRALDNGRYIN